MTLEVPPQNNIGTKPRGKIDLFLFLLLSSPVLVEQQFGLVTLLVLARARSHGAALSYVTLAVWRCLGLCQPCRSCASARTRLPWVVAHWPSGADVDKSDEFSDLDMEIWVKTVW